MRLIKNEIKKIILSKKYMIAMGILFILYLGLTYLSCKDTINSKPEKLISKNKTYIEYLQKEKEGKDISEKRKVELDNNIKFMEERNKDLEFQLENKNIDWKEKLQKHNSVLKEQLKAAEENKDNKEISNYKMQIASNEYYLKDNIEPTADDEITAFTMMPKINTFMGLLITSIIIAIIASDSISGEFNPATIKLLLTKPISRKRVLFLKFTATVLTCIFSFIILKTIMFIALGIIFKFGSYKEPIAFYTRYVADKDLIAKTGLGVIPNLNSLKIYSVLKFTLISEAVNVLFITACVSICFLISTVTKKSSISISISVILFTIISVINTSQLDGGSAKNMAIRKLMPYLFSSYSSAEFIVSGEIIRKLGFEFMSIPFIIFILLAWIVISYFISNYVFLKRDIL